MYQITQHPVGNFAHGRPGAIDMIVIHVAVATLQGTFNTFNNVAEQKSSHYCVGEAGEIWQFVQEADTAWHAGLLVGATSPLVLSRPGVNPNSYSVGIENAGNYPGDLLPDDFTPTQYDANGWLVAQVAKAHNIPLDRTHIIGHNQIRSDKDCPGTKVSLDRIIAIAQGYMNGNTVPAPTTDKTAQLKAEIQSVLSKY